MLNEETIKAFKNYLSKKLDTKERLEAWYEYVDCRDMKNPGSTKLERALKIGLYDNLYDTSQLENVRKFYEEPNIK